MMVPSDSSSVLTHQRRIRQGDLVIVFERDDRMKPVKVTPGSVYHNRFGAFNHSDWVGKPFGSKVFSNLGKFVYLLFPTPELWTLVLSHRTQILYLADISFVVMYLEAVPGCVVLESGTGSGSLSTSLARAVAPNGHVYTFDFHEERAVSAREDFEKTGLSSLITVGVRDIQGEGFPDEFVGRADAVFLDLPGPWLAIPSAAKMLKPDGVICSFSPCIEQVSRSCDTLSTNFTDIKTFEVLLRTYEVEEIRTESSQSGGYGGGGSYLSPCKKRQRSRDKSDSSEASTVMAKPCAEGDKVCKYLFVRCDNSPAPWSVDVHGDRPRPLPHLDLENAFDITEKEENPHWYFDDCAGCWVHSEYQSDDKDKAEVGVLNSLESACDAKPQSQTSSGVHLPEFDEPSDEKEGCLSPKVNGMHASSFENINDLLVSADSDKEAFGAQPQSQTSSDDIVPSVIVQHEQLETKAQNGSVDEASSALSDVGTAKETGDLNVVGASCTIAPTEVNDIVITHPPFEHAAKVEVFDENIPADIGNFLSSEVKSVEASETLEKLRIPFNEDDTKEAGANNDSTGIKPPSDIHCSLSSLVNTSNNNPRNRQHQPKETREKAVTVIKTSQKSYAKQKRLKIRNRGRRRTQQWVWVAVWVALIIVDIIIILFFFGYLNLPEITGFFSSWN